MATNANEWLEGRDLAQRETVRRAARSGPMYMPRGNITPWHDQFFAREITPAGTVNCPQALRVGSTVQALQVSLLASHANEDNLVLPDGATITLNLLQGDAEKGSFEDVGPTMCVKVPAGGKVIPRDGLVYSFPLTDFSRPWLMVSLTFDGAITGGTVDVALSYAPR